MNKLRIAGALLAIVAAAALSAVTFAAPQAQEPLDKAAVEKIVRAYLLKHPEILVEMTQALEAKAALGAQARQRDALAKLSKGALLDPKVAYVTGPANATVTVVEFFDYRCAYCKNSLPAMQKLVTDNQVRVAFVEHPILTTDSVVAARAAVAARQQTGKYVPFHFALMKSSGDLPLERILQIAEASGLDVAKLQKDMEDPAVAESVAASNALANSLYVDGTPTFIIGGKIVAGALTVEEMQKLVKEAESQG
ncbi:MAG: DsbA family protein [Alphaproteobacteria bacterium]